VGDTDLIGACEICIRESTYFPMPAEILKRVTPADNFLVTSTVYDDSPLGEDDKKAFQTEMAAVARKLDVRPIIAQKMRERSALPRTWSETNYIAMVGSKTLQEWALGQDLNDDLPRSAQEIECIRTVQNYGKPRKKRRRYHEQRGI
jgi:hypothetical protein